METVKVARQRLFSEVEESQGHGFVSDDDYAISSWKDLFEFCENALFWNNEAKIVIQRMLDYSEQRRAD